jgi:hypothetical protein
MGFAGTHVPAATEHAPVAYDEAAHPRIGGRGVEAVAGELDAGVEEGEIGRRERHR